ncbi:hypothetical protein [Pseudodesulfovibrio portus]|uniref:Uncharacterized protein n=1 Tax=Pseudodesulfovibrio portus TaxID=231439 RepID=A0ABM8ANT6_9BACT|nr:hypothetical protein [Pseudodesulfovibrio portus]BDQ33035.1 hypothetical protein JCM14722_05770 [Pseudodesulfovibrio portus]
MKQVVLVLLFIFVFAGICWGNDQIDMVKMKSASQIEYKKAYELYKKISDRREMLSRPSKEYDELDYLYEVSDKYTDYCKALKAMSNIAFQVDGCDNNCKKDLNYKFQSGVYDHMGELVGLGMAIRGGREYINTPLGVEYFFKLKDTIDAGLINFNHILKIDLPYFKFAE